MLSGIKLLKIRCLYAFGYKIVESTNVYTFSGAKIIKNLIDSDAEKVFFVFLQIL